jgi:glutamine amidotransferase
MITIVDYGMGNLGSVASMLRRIEADCEVTGDPARIARAERILLPGVGAFDAAMERIESSGLRPVLDRKALEERVPVLGICLGMQLLTASSEEGVRPGFGWIPGRTRRIPTAPGIRVPHMGWNEVEVARESRLTRGLAGDVRFYFVHSYCVHADDQADVILRSRHGIGFAAAVERGNVMGAQFHPEKSHRFGMQLLRNFAEMTPC